MDFLRNHKTTLIGVGVIVLLFVLYSIFFGGGGDDSALIVSDVGDTGTVGREIITLLAELEAITLDTTVIDSEAFDQLVDFNRPVAEQPVGRPNPFLPIGR